jgi:leucyl/phenylalanyl-tRNA--protein transferase
MSGDSPMLLRPGSAPRFPDPARASREGLLAVGGDLSPARLLHAYDRGIFPWYGPGLPILWWSPDPRAILPRDRLHVPRSLARRIRHRGFELSWNRAFQEVIAACGEDREEGTWLIPEMTGAYTELHRLGHAHSLEVWQDGKLQGGLYGVQRGGLFAAESMFHRATDLSKVALVAAVQSLHAAGIELFEVQFVTPHLQRFGAVAIRRQEYLRRLQQARGRSVDLSHLALVLCPD